jgi:serine/threonine-protein kinase OSR1/STK39
MGMSSRSGTDIEEQEDHEDIEGDSVVQNVKFRRICGWSFNDEEFELDPVFPTDPKYYSVLKQVRFGGESIIPENKSNCKLVKKMERNSEGMWELKLVS